MGVSRNWIDDIFVFGDRFRMLRGEFQVFEVLRENGEIEFENRVMKVLEKLGMDPETVYYAREEFGLDNIPMEAFYQYDLYLKDREVIDEIGSEYIPNL